MKTKFIAFSVAVALAGASFAANAAVEGTWDIGAKVGAAWANAGTNDDMKFSDKNGYGVGLYAGYNIKSWVGVEAGFNYFGGFKVKELADNAEHSTHMWGPEFAVRLAYPFDEKGSDIYVRGGVAGLYLDAKDGSNEHAFSPLLGLGIQYHFTKSFGIRAGYDYYFNVPDIEYNTKKVDYDGLHFAYLGFQFTFGGESAPVKKEQAKVRVTESHNLQAGTLFPFDGSVLSAQGKKEISDVVASSKKLDAAEFEVYGYTDRIGSDAYNLKLSQKRADAVANELVSDGVTPKVVEGRGKANPVTGNKCDTVKGKKALVDCLAPDRRVEILVSGDTSTEKTL